MGASQDLPENIQRASEYFGLFSDTEALDLFVVETNRDAEQFLQSNPRLAASNYYKGWTPCNRAKVKCYLALIIHMGVVQFPRISDHWSQSNQYTCLLCPSLMAKMNFSAYIALYIS